MKKEHRDRALALADQIDGIVELVELLAGDADSSEIEAVGQELETAADTLRTEAGE